MYIPAGRDGHEDAQVYMMQNELLTGILCKNQLGGSNLSLPHLVHELYGPHATGKLFGALGRVLTLTLQKLGFSMAMDDMLLVHE